MHLVVVLVHGAACILHDSIHCHLLNTPIHESFHQINDHMLPGEPLCPRCHECRTSSPTWQLFTVASNGILGLLSCNQLQLSTPSLLDLDSIFPCLNKPRAICSHMRWSAGRSFRRPALSPHGQHHFALCPLVVPRNGCRIMLSVGRQ